MYVGMLRKKLGNLCYLLEWLRGLCRFENIKAIIGSLKRRIFKLSFLEMRINLSEQEIPLQIWAGTDIRRYFGDIEDKCIILLNSLGSFGMWNESKFRRDIMSSVEDIENDIFLLWEANSLIGFAVVHKKSLNNGLNEIGYIAVRPESRGKKLGYKLLMYILAEMKRRSIASVYLRTDSFRVPAIKTYLKCGFYPYITDENERGRWQLVMEKLGINTIGENKYGIGDK